jgi:hypothetical protein
MNDPLKRFTTEHTDHTETKTEEENTKKSIRDNAIRVN